VSPFIVGFVTITPEQLHDEETLVSAATRFDYLRRRNEVAPVGGIEPAPDVWGAEEGTFDEDEALELLALGAVIARKAHDGRQEAIESARLAGASWEDISAALDEPLPAVRDEHADWLAEKAEAEPEHAAGAAEA